MGRGWWYKTFYEKQLLLKRRSFRERSNFRRIWFRDLRFRIWGLEIKHMKAHNFVWQVFCLFSLLSRNFDDRLSLNFHKFVILCICWYTPSEKTGLWQVSSVFNRQDSLWNNTRYKFQRKRWFFTATKS